MDGTKIKDLKELKIERPARIKLSAKNRSSGPQTSTSERSALLPLLEEARVEVYLPPPTSRVLQSDELTGSSPYTFGGCTIIQGLDGSYYLKPRTPYGDQHDSTLYLAAVAVS